MFRLENTHRNVTAVAALHILGALLLLEVLLAPQSVSADTFSIDPKATYQQTHPADLAAVDAVPLTLASLGLAPGTFIRLETLGDFRFGPELGTSPYMLGVFSGSDTLLPSTERNRVQDAIDAGNDFTTGPVGEVDTDIPEDFFIFDSPGVIVQVPAGATHLFVSAADIFFGDNNDAEGDFALRITLVVNQPPSATDDFYGMDQASSLSVPAPGILANDSDADDDPLSVEVVTGPAHAASFQLNPDGSFAYTPHPYFAGEDAFTYVADDGATSSEIATVLITVRQPGSQGFITGGGKLFVDGGRCTFGFVAKAQADGVQGQLEFQDHDAGLNIHADTVDVVYAADQSEGYFEGLCALNGEEGYMFFVEVHDAGSGNGDDFAIWVFDLFANEVYSGGGVLAGGSITIHNK